MEEKIIVLLHLLDQLNHTQNKKKQLEEIKTHLKTFDKPNIILPKVILDYIDQLKSPDSFYNEQLHEVNEKLNQNRTKENLLQEISNFNQKE